MKTEDKKEALLFIKHQIRVKRIDKMISTYYDRIENNTHPDMCFRGYFNHCSTITGRLTSDLQQTPKKNVSNVKLIFKTRY